jgi:hypothetical protein
VPSPFKRHRSFVDPIIVCDVPGVTYATITDQELERVGGFLEYAHLTVHKGNEDDDGVVMTVPVDFPPF